MSKIFLIGADDALVPMNETAYESEALLQTLLERYPEVLAGHSAGTVSDARWLLVSREFGVPDQPDGADRWSLDHLFLDHEGVPTLVEVKRASDTRIRREVVAQMLDYAANAVVYWPVDGIRAKFEAGCQARSRDPADEVRGLASRFDVEDGSGVELFWQDVKTNLQAGRIRLVFVADQVPGELQRIVEFLNEQMDPAEVIAIEIRQFVGKNVRTLVPTLVGRTAAAERRKLPGRTERQWDAEAFFADLESREGHEAVGVARQLLAWSTSQFSRISWGRGVADGSFTPILETQFGGERVRRKVTLFSVWTYGRVEITFQYVAARLPFDTLVLREGLRARLEPIAGIDVPPDAIERRPSFPIVTLADAARMKAFEDAMTWAIAEVRRLETESAGG